MSAALSAPPSTAPSSFSGYDHLHLWVSNAKQAASYYILRFGFTPLAYRGLETGSREVATHVVRQRGVILALSSPLNPVESEMGRRIMIAGDAVKDVAFTVDDCASVYAAAVERGAKSILAPVRLEDKDGHVILATIQTYGDTTHTLVQRADYRGAFLPGYTRRDAFDPLSSLLPSPELLWIDHIVGNQPDHQMMGAVDWYEKVFGFHRFWSVDDRVIHTGYSSLRSIVMADPSDRVKMPINEPAEGKRKSQIQEFVDYMGGPGVQHVALRVSNILHTLPQLKARGLEFLNTPSSYYDDVRTRLSKSPLVVKESIDELQRLSILIDFDDTGYLLQIFTKPQQDRPTLFYEVIQREGHQGFGAGNFKALFEAIEREQAERGNLDNDKPSK